MQTGHGAGVKWMHNGDDVEVTVNLNGLEISWTLFQNFYTCLISNHVLFFSLWPK